MIVKYHEYTIQINIAQLQPPCHQTKRRNNLNWLTMRMNLYTRTRNDQNTKHQEKRKHGINSFNTRDEYYCYYYYYYYLSLGSVVICCMSLLYTSDHIYVWLIIICLGLHTYMVIYYLGGSCACFSSVTKYWHLILTIWIEICSQNHFFAK